MVNSLKNSTKCGKWIGNSALFELLLKKHILIVDKIKNKMFAEILIEDPNAAIKTDMKYRITTFRCLQSDQKVVGYFWH